MQPVDHGERVGGPGERGSGVGDGRIEDLKAERDTDPAVNLIHLTTVGPT
jgi:hypothetical protein